ncbi:type II toxin-antitoxin system RelB/DinJ family antitoxin [Pseudomonas lactucae]|uniref:Type II toxin-antitoxin system RelB/DinJ family antitoxin n=1 Tax=Pseudomonas lactucae TaxID=2813360 RepID=A0A9X0Y9E8_9PSED|nr:type II toxin-antitoxin system RelB/DinJ family antitoxin [Pseudomonas lactucae]MBN2974936.1 type II toxin-antitoxin system RelB/DinJ family antitoxin [Pseudomonas lactucae]MBN2986044.1 type II toxin-antitoxin system RelB/DinJ family antitoxin [Pseudomonas lactucae]
MATVLKNTDVRCRIDVDLKERATAVLNACGLSVSDAMRLFFRQVVEVEGLPFEVRVPSARTAKALEEAREIRRQYDSMDEMLSDLNGETSEKAKRKAFAAA